MRTDAKPAYINELAEFVTQKMDEARTSGRVVTTQTLALMAALTIADELFELRSSQLELKRQVRERSERILRYLDREAAV